MNSEDKELIDTAALVIELLADKVPDEATEHASTKYLIKELRLLAARSDSEDTSPVTGTPQHTELYNTVKEFIEDNEIKNRANITEGGCFDYVKYLIEELCEIVGYYKEEEE
ncbi:MAG: hypothetical protein JKY81_01635 [Colwellia sp.]|nr:hypothetical protein [Colwellia sp.]